MKTIHNISFVEFVRITFDNKMTVMGPDDNYINGSWVCGWCQHRVFIGVQHSMVPEDLRAWFLSPQQYEELCKILQNEGEQQLTLAPFNG